VAKAELRARMRALRKMQRGIPILKPFLHALPAWRGATRVGCYCAVRGEFGVESAILDARVRGVEVALPRVQGDRLCFHLWDGSPLVPGSFGIPEPAAGLPLVSASELDVILVPGLAFDAAGGRLGNGGGFYDRVLAEPRGLAVGTCWSAQVVDAVPMDPWDQHVDALLTERGWVARV
jgi:5-formyltetrahydrofolate cyclo-ligase